MNALGRRRRFNNDALFFVGKSIEFQDFRRDPEALVCTAPVEGRGSRPTLDS
jgi:hypothetical protein